MKYIKYSLFVTLAATMFTSCLKSRSDAGGLLDDKGSIVTSIAEQAYINTDAQNIGAGFTNTFANFNFGTRPNESVKFFTLNISQPRETKISGSMTLHITAADLLPIDPSGLVSAPLPAGAISVQDITVPASGASSISVPVMFNVNKTLLNPGQIYGAQFRVVSSSQGAVSALDSSIAVVFNGAYIMTVGTPSYTINNSDYQANYKYSNDVVDPVNQFGIHQRTALRYIREVAANTLELEDTYFFNLQGVTSPNLVVNNFTTGATTSIFRPNFILNASGVVTSVVNASASAAVTNLALDPSGANKFTYTSNNQREFHVKYSFTLTTTINGVVTPRTVKVSEDLTYDPNQIYF